MSYLSSFTGRSLRKEMAEKGIFEEDLAKILGVHKGSVHRWCYRSLLTRTVHFAWLAVKFDLRPYKYWTTKEIRKEFLMTQTQLADRMGISIAASQAWDSERVPLSMLHRYALSYLQHKLEEERLEKQTKYEEKL